MYIPDKDWDDLNNFCCDLAEQLQAMPEDIFFACKNEAIQLCHSIMNAQDKPKEADWTSLQIRDIPEGEVCLLSEKDSVYLSMNGTVMLLKGEGLPLDATSFTHWMRVPNAAQAMTP